MTGPRAPNLIKENYQVNPNFPGLRADGPAA